MVFRESLIGLTEHARLAENVLDHRLHSRMVCLNRVLRFFQWEMNYPVEPHMFPLVRHHALGKVHEELKADMPPADDGLWAAYREIILTLVRLVKDPTYHAKRERPVPVVPVPALEPVEYGVRTPQPTGHSR